MSAPVSGRPMVPSEAPRRDEASVKVSSASEHICLPNLTSKVPKNSQFLANLIAPAVVHCAAAINISLDLSTLGDPPVQISAKSETICCTKSTGEVPKSLFIREPSTFSLTLAISDNHSSSQAPIWNAHSQAHPLVPAPLSNSSPVDVNFRSTFSLLHTIVVTPSATDCAAVTDPKFNSFGESTPQVMGNRPMSSIVDISLPIKNVQFSGLISSSSASSSMFGLSSSEFKVPVAGSGVPSSSTADGCAPATVVRVDSVESPSQLGRVNSEVPLVFKVDSAVQASFSVGSVPPKVSNVLVSPVVGSARYVPPTVSFQDILRRSSPPSQAQSFADVVDLMDEMPSPTHRDVFSSWWLLSIPNCSVQVGPDTCIIFILLLWIWASSCLMTYLFDLPSVEIALDGLSHWFLWPGLLFMLGSLCYIFPVHMDGSGCSLLTVSFIRVTAI